MHCCKVHTDGGRGRDFWFATGDRFYWLLTLRAGLLVESRISATFHRKETRNWNVLASFRGSRTATIDLQLDLLLLSLV